MSAVLKLFATCPKGIEDILANELRSLGASSVKLTRAGVYFEGSMEIALAACLWSRVANRILLPLSEFESPDPETLYREVNTLPWEEHISPDGTIAVDASVSSSSINDSRYAALKVKDAVVDRIRDLSDRRPSVKKNRPDVRLNVHIYRDRATVSIDLSGESLHRRGYRLEKGEAPLKENLAAAILIRAGWPEVAAKGGEFIDPMCGSGTLPIEAAMMAADMAPGVNREYFGFLGWKKFESSVWTKLQIDARYRMKEGLARLPKVVGLDSDGKALRSAESNLKRCGLEGKVEFSRGRLTELKAEIKGAGLVVANPPYGERLGEVQKLGELYSQLGELLRNKFSGWKAAVFTGNPDLGKQMGIRARKSNVLYNGPMKCSLLQFDVEEKWFYRELLEGAVGKKEQKTQVDKKGSSPELSPGAQMVANRLKKNLKTIGKWAKREGIECYRLYDADMPEYNLAVDIYGSKVNVAEYEAPINIPHETAEIRLSEALDAVKTVLGVSMGDVHIKVRKRQRGRSQYEKKGDTQNFFEITEGKYKFLVNLDDYLDTGLFLDHRLTRGLIEKLAKGKRFLNLFCYTGSATVYAAGGGASNTTSVDLSNTYIDWAGKNMTLNGFTGRLHRKIRTDCLQWIARESRKYGLIFLDPPTYSTSKGMDKSFDVQRDHVELIKNTAALLDRNGILIFSSNRRDFKLDYESLGDLLVEDITKSTIPRDFERRPNIHNCFRIEKKSS